MNKLLNQLGVDETLTRPRKPPKQQYHSSANYISRQPHVNYQADLLEMPTTKEGYNRLLVVTDMWTRAFDIEPLSNKSADVVRKAYQSMLRRPYLQPPAYIKTDGGSEFAKLGGDKRTMHLTGLPYRHNNQAAVERLNQSLGRVFNGYMNKVEEKTGKVYRNWSDIIDFVRTELNKVRYRKPESNLPSKTPDLSRQPKFQAGELVHRKLEYPENALGHKQPTATFRTGDYRYERHPRKVVVIRQMNEKPWFRYFLEGIPQTSFAEWELLKSTTQDGETRFVVHKLVDRMRRNRQTHYKVRWKGYTKKHDSWEPESRLREDVPELIESYVHRPRARSKRRR